MEYFSGAAWLGMRFFDEVLTTSSDGVIALAPHWLGRRINWSRDKLLGAATSRSQAAVRIVMIQQHLGEKKTCKDQGRLQNGGLTNRRHCINTVNWGLRPAGTVAGCHFRLQIGSRLPT